ncbi:MAG: UDP-N-acetylmuramoylalanyl-D-glutamyl-2,6-diaminopimelate--D-alanyl-D-alanine ligase [Sneathiella sp.]|nr:UDP-N-acetylmuramoylalanyl-D-glutamyl-2,6-diaminopimelate--D-alanyl-D-alanine ligase [Sneathiella sp.]
MTNPLWTADAIINATGGSCDQRHWMANGVAIDSRAVKAGDLFIAIVGPNNDGHDYVAQALKSGAAAAIVSRPISDADGPLVVVHDTQTAMEDLGRAARARTNAKIIAVTGSVGKTGTKEALAHILSDQGKTHFAVGSFNNHWGVPLSLARMPADTEYGIFELAMNHAGELTPLSKMVAPHVAIITTIAAAHMEFFDSLDDIARAKAEIFHGLLPGGTALINGDIPETELLKSEAVRLGVQNLRLFGAADNTEIHLEDVTIKSQFSDVSATLEGDKLDFHLPVPGRHWVQNMLAALGAVHHVGADVAQAVFSLQSIKAPSGRGVQLKLKAKDGGDYRLIDESYNASPIAMQAAFKVLGKVDVHEQGRRIAVLGDMRELGEKSDEIHRSLANDLLENHVDMLYASGPHMKHLFEALPHNLQAGYAVSSDGLVDMVLAAVTRGDVVLIKGSLGSKMKVILDALVAQSDAVKAAAGAEE